MTDRLDDILKFADLKTPPHIPARKESPTYPKGFEPGVIYEGERITVIPEGQEEEITDWSPVLEKMGFSAEEFEVIEPVNSRIWLAAIGDGQTKWMHYYRANVRKKTSDAPDFEELYREIRKIKRPTRKLPNGEDTFIVNLADWQLGKADGDGTEGTIKRVLSLKDALVERIKDLRKIGRPLDTLVLAGLGDMGENCDGHYAMQTNTVELNYRDQRKYVRRLVLDLIKTLAPMFNRVVILAVPGNHGEVRKNGKAFTSFDDNVDVAIFEDLYDILQMNQDAYGHVTFVLPTDSRLEIVLNLSGKIVAFAHGHQFTRGGATIQQKMMSWWKGQMQGKQPAGDADILISGHFHHFQVIQEGSRIWFQCPALEWGSEWFRNTSGLHAEAGTLTMRIDPELGVRDVEILR